MTEKVMNMDLAITLIEDAYDKGWSAAVSEPRPFKAARDSMRSRYMEQVKRDISDGEQ